MGKAFYRKYRPKKLAEVVGQEHVTDTLARAFESGHISHAYLLTGPKGVGKTSIARIIAYEVNGLPYEEEATHLDIIEIDAASNRRIDEIRELKERVHIAPTSAKYRVYIIDEVHMLTKEAFNALLKTLEEPPEHAIFILATTEAHKVPETIISRTQRFTFKPVPLEKVVNHLKQIAKQEKISIDDEALSLIAAHGEGSFRDSISLLDQVRHTSANISLADVQQAIGHAPKQVIEKLTQAILDHDLQAIANCLRELQVQGAQPASVAKQLSAVLRKGIINNNAVLESVMTLLSDLLHVPTSTEPSVALELALYKASLMDKNTSRSMPEHEVLPNDIQTPKKTAQMPSVPPKASTPPPVLDIIEKTKTPTPPAQAPASASSVYWQQILAAIKSKHNTLYSVARMAEPEVEPSKITLNFKFAFHKKRLDDTKNRQILLSIIKEVTGQPLELECIVATEPFHSKIAAAPITENAKNEHLEAISNIFGNAEIVE